MKDIKHEVASHTWETEKVCLWAYLLKNNQVQQIVKYFISSMLHMHVFGLSRPGSPC